MTDLQLSPVCSLFVRKGCTTFSLALSCNVRARRWGMSDLSRIKGFAVKSQNVILNAWFMDYRERHFEKDRAWVSSCKQESQEMDERWPGSLLHYYSISPDDNDLDLAISVVRVGIHSWSIRKKISCSENVGMIPWNKGGKILMAAGPSCRTTERFL